MDKVRAIPKGYMTVGEVAKKMDITVRTMQYYDKEGLLSPSAESEGGRRLYTDKDVVKLHQILSMKHLGFSLDDIKNRIISLDTPEEVATALTEQGDIIREKIKGLSNSLLEIEALKKEVLQMQQVNFKKYADIIVNLQMKNQFYWLIKHFDDNTLDDIRSRFDMDSGMAMMEQFNKLQDEAIRLQKAGISPIDEEARHLAVAFWDMITEFTGGDMSLLPKLIELGDVEKPNEELNERQNLLNAFIAPALEAYFDSSGINPFEGNEGESLK